MSESKEKEQTPSALSPAVIFRRRAATLLYLLFLATCFVGAQGPWWEVWVAGKLVPNSQMRGPDFLSVSLEPLPGAEDSEDFLTKYRRVRVEHTLTPARIVIACCLLAFFACIYNLFGDHDAQLPVFLLSLVIAATACYVVYRVWADNSAIEGALTLQTQGEIAKIASETTTAPPSTPGATPAPTQLPKTPAQAGRLPVWKPLWGYALFVSSALVLLLDSIFLTLVAQRGEP